MEADISANNDDDDDNDDGDDGGGGERINSNVGENYLYALLPLLLPREVGSAAEEGKEFVVVGAAREAEVGKGHKSQDVDDPHHS